VTVYGYASVSTDGQTVAAQVAELTAAGAAKVFHETASGAKSDRAELAKLLTRLEPGDTVLVTRLDRLARSTRDCSTRCTRLLSAASASSRWVTPGATGKLKQIKLTHRFIS
jgi:DNA invertase Pin-like site-specific DNA recombinase